MLLYDLFARSWNWTPRQVDELSLDEISWLPIIGEARALAAEALADK
jgi:hypothetical protein